MVSLRQNRSSVGHCREPMGEAISRTYSEPKTSVYVTRRLDVLLSNVPNHGLKKSCKSIHRFQLWSLSLRN